MYIKYSPEERCQKYREVRLKYQQAHKEETKAQKHKYYEEHKEERSLKSHQAYLIHREENVRRTKLYYEAHKHDEEYKLKKRIYNRKRNQSLKLEVIDHYSVGNIPQCVRCGITDLDVLCIDHINGGGGKHRRNINTGLTSWLKLHNYPDGYQILCANCNLKKRIQEDEYHLS